jgi:hypothetical protein
MADERGFSMSGLVMDTNAAALALGEHNPGIPERFPSPPPTYSVIDPLQPGNNRGPLDSRVAEVKPASAVPPQYGNTQMPLHSYEPAIDPVHTTQAIPVWPETSTASYAWSVDSPHAATAANEPWRPEQKTGRTRHLTACPHDSASPGSYDWSPAPTDYTRAMSGPVDPVRADPYTTPSGSVMHIVTLQERAANRREPGDTEASSLFGEDTLHGADLPPALSAVPGRVDKETEARKLSSI